MVPFKDAKDDKDEELISFKDVKDEELVPINEERG